MSATDRDIGTNAQISYFISNGDTSKFSIDPDSGLISTTAELDREQVPSYTLSVTAKDSGNPSLSSVVPLKITVLDENDNPPQFTAPAYNVVVMENTAKDTTVFRVRATDPDEGNYGKVTYSITDGAKGKFTIDADTGKRIF